MHRSAGNTVACRVVVAALFFVRAFCCNAAGEVENVAKNIARMNCGARIEWLTPDGRVVDVPAAGEKTRGASALIMDDSTLSCPLTEGETTFIISFPKTSLLDRFTFVNENAAAEGELKIAVSNYQLPAVSSRWTPVNDSVPFTGKRLFNLSLVGVEARYVKLSFHVQKGGRIAALGLYGTESLQRFAQRQDGPRRVTNVVAARRLEDVVNFNFANIYAKAHIVFVSSGPNDAARRMIDDDTTTAFRFAASDPQPTAIVELGESERLHRVSALYRMQAGTLDVFVMDRLPADAADLRDARLVASVRDEDGDGKAAVNFNPLGARYVAFRWTPDANTAEPFEVAEVSAFGDAPVSILSTLEAPDLYASADYRLHTTGEGGPDFSNKLGTLADPPVLAVVSP